MRHSEISSFASSDCPCCRRSPAQREADDRVAKLVPLWVRCPVCNRGCPSPEPRQLQKFAAQVRKDQAAERFADGTLKPLHVLNYHGSGSAFRKRTGFVRRPTAYIPRPTVSLARAV